MKDWFCSEQLVLYPLETYVSHASKVAIARCIVRLYIVSARELLLLLDLCLIAGPTTHQLMPRLNLPSADA